MRIRSAWTTGLLVAAIGVWISVAPALASTTPSHNLADLVTGASDIVAGTVTEVTDTRLGNLPVTEVQLEVKEVIKGARDVTVDEEGRMFLTIRQLGLQNPEPAQDGRVYIGLTPGMAKYEVGQSVMLFLAPGSSNGLRATVGLSQGRFDLAAGGVVNSARNHGLFGGMPQIPGETNEAEDRMLGTQEGSVNSRTFVNFVRRAVAGDWWVGQDQQVPERQVDDLDNSGSDMTLGGN